MLEEELQLEIAVLAALHLEVLLEGLQDKIILEEAAEDQLEVGKLDILVALAAVAVFLLVLF